MLINLENVNINKEFIVKLSPYNRCYLNKLISNGEDIDVVLDDCTIVYGDGIYTISSYVDRCVADRGYLNKLLLKDIKMVFDDIVIDVSDIVVYDNYCILMG